MAGDGSGDTLRVMALHSLSYCERLFYLEEVEEIRVADHRVYAGRTLHESLGEDGPVVEWVLEDAELGLRGKVDAIRRRDGRHIVYEHKRGRSRTGEGGAEAWDTDRLQVGGYALLLERALGDTVAEARIRYHADNKLVRVPVDAGLRSEVAAAIERARVLASSTDRPPITEHDRRCERCSLAPVCLPEETRAALDDARKPLRLFPEKDERLALHVAGYGTSVGKKGHELEIRPREGERRRMPIREVRSVTVHDYGAVTTRALQLCANHGVAVHWFGSGGYYIGSFTGDDRAVQRRTRQFEALREPAFCLKLARKLATARIESQLRFVLRATRGRDREAEGLSGSILSMRRALNGVGRAASPGELRGLEGQAARAYFEILPSLVLVDEELAPRGRSRRPPRDPFNCLLGFGYGMLLREVVQAIRVVGLEPAFGFYHRPRSSAPPLALDLIELFRVPCVDIPVLGAVNRRHFNVDDDFTSAADQVWLTKDGRKKLIRLLERRLEDTWRHPLLKYSLSYRRHVELEVRLLEKEWGGEPGMFARTRLR